MRLLLPALALLLLAGCTRAPRPSQAVPAPPVFAPSGDTSEVLSTIPEPVHHGRPAQAQPTPAGEPSGDSGQADTSADAEDSLSSEHSQPGLQPTPPAGAPSRTATPAPAPAPQAATPPPVPEAPAGLWVVQVFAGSERAAAYREAQRAQRALGLKDDEVATALEGRLWRVRVGAPVPREQAASLLERARREFPKAFLVQVPEGR